MRVLVAPDKFKGSLTALQAAQAMEKGIHQAHPSWGVDCIPMADGGDGTLDAIAAALGGTMRVCTVAGPLGSSLPASYLLLPDGRTAVIEMARASGLAFLAPTQRDPMRATTLGVGQLLLDALQQGRDHIILGLGGSATNDGGLGLMAALGARFTTADGAALPLANGQSLVQLAYADFSPVSQFLSSFTLDLLCDVQNPLCGPNGATFVFGPQKGVTPTQLPILDGAMARWGTLLERAFGRQVCTQPGAGAAGGLGAALLALGGTIYSGTDYLMQLVHWKERIAQADLVLTGEGRLDASSCFGKAPFVIMQSAYAHGLPCYAFCGTLQTPVPVIQGLTRAFAVSDHLSEREQKTRTASALQASVYNWALQFP